MANKRDEELEQLKKLSPYSLPDNPSQSGWSTKQVKAKFYQGLFYLYQLFAGFRDDVGEMIVGVSVNENDGTITFEKNDGTTETFSLGSGNVNIYYDDTLPEDNTKIRTGDIWFNEDN